MIVNGIDLGELLPDADDIVLPDVVKGRTVHIDADFLAYQTTAVGAGKEVSFDDMKHNASVAINTLKGMAGAEFVHLHTTPSGSNKGGRYEIALLKEYQGIRKDKEKPQFLNHMRQHLTTAYPGTSHQFCEADDGMSSAQYQAIAAGQSNLSIIASKDKDLRMVPGLHLDWDTGEIVNCEDPFGWTAVKKMKSGNKMVGYGWKFFWSQMLTGDQADNISGLPLVHGQVMLRIAPTVQAKKAQAVLDKHPATISQEARRLAQDFLDNYNHKPCGVVTADTLLSNIDTNKKAFVYITNLFKMEPAPYYDYRSNVRVSWQQAMISEMKLLWMRRSAHDADDVVKWLREHCA